MRPKSNNAQIILAICAIIALPFTIYSVFQNQSEDILNSDLGDTYVKKQEKIRQSNNNSDFVQKKDMIEVQESQLTQSQKIDEAADNFLNYSPGVKTNYFDEFISLKDYDSALEVLRIAKTKTTEPNGLKSIDLRKRSILLMQEKGFDNVWFSFPGEFVLTERESKYGLYSRSGLELYKPTFDSIDPLNFSPLYGIEKNDKFGFLDQNGNEIYFLEIDEIEPEEFYPLKMFKIKNKYGLISDKGKILFEPIFDEINRVWSKSIIVKVKDKYGVIDIAGKYKIDLSYDAMTYNIENNTFKGVKNNTEKYFDDNGAIIENPIFDLTK